MSSIAQAVRVVGTGCRTQWKLNRVSPLAVVTDAVAPIAYGAAMTAGYGRPSQALLIGALAAVPGILRMISEDADPDTLVLYTREPAAATGYLLDQLGDQVLSVSVAPPSLEDAYLAALG